MKEHQNTNSLMTPFRELTTTWVRAVKFTFTITANANRIVLAAFSNRTNEDSVEPAPTASLTYTKADWRFERSADSPEDLSVGDYVMFSKTITDADVRSFAEASGDTNRVHLDEEFARKTRFGERVAPGTLVSGLISAALAYLPGTVVYLSQDISFLEPVHLGETLTAKCRIVEEIDEDNYRLATTIRNRNGDSVIVGNATILVDPLPEKSDEP